MNLPTLICRAMPLAAWCGLLAVACLAGGCGPKPAAPPAPAKPAAKPASAATAVPQGAVTDKYVSIFDDVPPPLGKDPFHPDSRRRDVHVETPQEPINVRVDPVLVLKAVIRTSKHSQAVINNEIFEVGETQSVRVPNGKVKVRCLRIGKNFAEVQVEGESEPKTLMMEQKKY